GWIDVSDRRRGVAIGIRHFIEEYPKELAIAADGQAQAFTWSPKAGPMSFARSSDAPGSAGAVRSWARGSAKAGGVVFYVRRAGLPEADVARATRGRLPPPVAQVDPAWYGSAGVYGHCAPRTAAFPEYLRALDYKFDWVLF